MLVFARFVMRDNGQPILINTPHVTQVRLTIDGEPAIYLLGKDTPILVEGDFESAMKKLEAAASGLRLVEPEPPAPEPEVATVTALPVALPSPEPAPAPPPAEPSSPRKAPRKVARAKPEPAASPAKTKAAHDPEPAEKAHAHTGGSWFKGLR
jgi:outer membrane biosynthesis protein TonB